MVGKAGGVLGVFAHPDDEEFGTSGALRFCVERGIPVRVLCATSGDAGEISDPSLATRENLAEVREAELREACRVLGLETPVLLRYGDGKLPEIGIEQLRDDIVRAFRTYLPRVVVTFDENGGYGHPDHIAIHHATKAAFAVSGDPAFRPEFGAPFRPEKLYFTAIPRSRFASMAELIKQYGLPEIEFGSVQTIPTEQIGTADERITTAVPVDHYWDVRWAAFCAHRTQFGPGNPIMQLPEAVVRKWMDTDVFVRAIPAPEPGIALPDEDDLWAGLYY